LASFIGSIVRSWLDPSAMATSWYAVWIPVVVFAHLFSLFWLVKTWALSKAQGLLRKKRKVSASPGPAKDPTPNPISQHPGTVRKDTNSLQRPSLLQRTRTFFSLARTTTLKSDGSFHSATSSDDSGVDEDAVPDVSLEACKTLRRTMSLVPDKMSLEWQDMGCTYQLRGAAKVVLQGISGRADPGEMQVSTQDDAQQLGTAKGIQTLVSLYGYTVPGSLMDTEQCLETFWHGTLAVDLAATDAL
jgi:hypothetical protein